MADVSGEYAFPHTSADEPRRPDLFAERLDPLTKRRVAQLSLARGARCLEVGGGRGSVARWLCEYVGPEGHVTATDLDTGFLAELSLPNLGRGGAVGRDGMADRRRGRPPGGPGRRA